MTSQRDYSLEIGLAPARALIMVAMIAFLIGTGNGRAESSLPSIAIDADNGAVLSSNRAFDRWYPASLTKLMTVYVTMRALRAGEIQPGSPVTMTRQAAAQPPSRMGLPVGTRLRVDTALQILVVKSANDVAVALAESVAGSIPLFVERMNAEANRLGMTDSRFANPNGLHSSDQYSTARDLAVLARQIFTEFPEFSKIFAVPAIRYGEEVDYSYNLLLERFDGADGMKTGFICASGYNMVASATRNGRHVIAVVLGAFSQTDRAIEAARLLLSGFEANGATTVGQFTRNGAPVVPTSQRGTICSKKAYETRYDPGAGDAKIDSPLLGPRRSSTAPLEVRTGGVDAPPSEAFLTAALAPKGKIPVPRPRPGSRDVDGEPISPASTLNAIPLPVKRPSR
ncbi:MAG: serine hydrolase [Nitratireductor sp.]|nr:serine hydrolase [Nitratireductor sp.]